MMEQVVLVNPQDQPIGLMDKLKAHQQGLLHRAFSVFVVAWHEEEVFYLLQQRNHNKYHCGGLWSNTCCSHPRKDELIIEAGERRLQEEMGFMVPLRKIGSFIYKAKFNNGLIEHEYDHVLLGVYDKSLSININNKEVAAYKWMSQQEIKSTLERHSETLTPWFTQVFHRVFKTCQDLAL